MSILSNLMSTAQSVYQRVSGNMPNDSHDVAPVPQKLVESEQFKLMRVDGNLAIYENTKSDKKFKFNLTLKVEKLKPLYSVYRAGEQSVVEDVMQRFAKFELLLSQAAKEDVFRMLVAEMHEHQFWQPVHVASSTDFSDYFSTDGTVSRVVNEKCQPECITALHIATLKCRQKSFDALIAAGADPSVVDGEKSTVFHAAAAMGSKCAPFVNKLKSHPSTSKCIDALNGNGYTALYLAVMTGSESMTSVLIGCGADASILCNGTSTLKEAMNRCTERHNRCMKPLLMACPQLAHERDPETGDTALHLAMDKERLSYMLDCLGEKADVNVRNLSNQTPLHLVASTDNVSVAVYLMAYGGDPEAKDAAGNTPLHLAVKAKKLMMTQCILLFYPKVNEPNADGQTARHLLSQIPAEKRKDFEYALDVFGAARCPKGYGGCSSSCAATDSRPVLGSSTNALHSFCQVAALRSVESQSDLLKQRNQDGLPKMVNLLALDGGGIRGLILIQVLLYIESVLGQRVSDSCHWLAGTSTGALLSIALSTGRSLRECQRLYIRFKDQVFKGVVRPYDTSILENFIKTEFTETAKMTDVKDHRLMVTAVKADNNPPKLELFRSYSIPVRDAALKEDLGFIDPSGIFLWKAARCSSAAPSYFATVDGKYVDGGIIANNPTLDLLSDVHLYNSALRYQNKTGETVQIGCVLSVGTGRVPDTPINSRLDIGIPDNILDLVLKSFAVKDLGNLLLDQVCATEGAPVDRARAWCHSMSTPFFRFCTPMSVDVAMDEKNDEVLVKMCWETAVYMHEHLHEVNQLCRLLRLTSP